LQLVLPVYFYSVFKDQTPFCKNASLIGFRQTSGVSAPELPSEAPTADF
jgi:hypothetical protein